MPGHNITYYSCGSHIELQCRCFGHPKDAIVGKRACPTCMQTTRPTHPVALKAQSEIEARLDSPVDVTPFEEKLRALLNSTSQEGGSDTPDFILAEYLSKCLDNFNVTVVCREKWYGRR